MSKFEHVDRDGDSLTIHAGEFGAVVATADRDTFTCVAVRRPYAVDVARELLKAAGIKGEMQVFCPECGSIKDIDDDYGRDDQCDTCFEDPTPDEQWAVTEGTHEPEVPC